MVCMGEMSEGCLLCGCRFVSRTNKYNQEQETSVPATTYLSIVFVSDLLTCGGSCMDIFCLFVVCGGLGKIAI